MNAPAPLRTGLGVRLSLMMFLQYAIWGAWLPLLWPYLNDHLGFEQGQIGNMFAVGAVGALIAPFIAGQIADRYFATERYLGISHILGGVLVWQLSWIESYWSFLIFSLLYSLIYAPTLALTNSLSFHHLPDRDRDFGRVRVWGTVGWIVVGITIGQWLLHSHTIDQQQATRVVVEDRLADAEERQRLLEQSAVTVADGTTIVGTVISQDDARVEVDVPGADAGAAPTRETVDAAEVESIRPLYETLAVEGRADDVRLAIELAGGQDLDAATEALDGALTDETLAGPIWLGQVAGMSDAFQLSAVLGVLMGLYCFFLPHTPPTPGKEKVATFEAVGEVKRNPLLTLFLLAVPISCIHQFYFVHTASFLGTFQSRTAEAINNVFGVGGAGLMTVGQMAEILVLAAIPLVAKKLSRKTLLLVGIVAYGLRMFLFAYVDAIHAATGLPEVAILIAGVALHGFCFGCFIFVAFMIVDEETTGDVKASAQSLFNVVIIGVGIIVGSKIAAGVHEWARTDAGDVDFRFLFSVPMWASLACLLILLIFYPGGRKAAASAAPTSG